MGNRKSTLSKDLYSPNIMRLSRNLKMTFVGIGTLYNITFSKATHRLRFLLLTFKKTMQFHLPFASNNGSSTRRWRHLLKFDSILRMSSDAYEGVALAKLLRRSYYGPKDLRFEFWHSRGWLTLITRARLLMPESAYEYQLRWKVSKRQIGMLPRGKVNEIAFVRLYATGTGDRHWVWWPHWPCWT